MAAQSTDHRDRSGKGDGRATAIVAEAKLDW
jgi:hypothetical protein